MKKSCLLLSILSMLSAFTLQASDASAQASGSKKPQHFMYKTATGAVHLGDDISAAGTVKRGAIMNALMNVDALAKANAAVATFDGNAQDFSSYQTIMFNLLNTDKKNSKKAVAAINGFKDTLSYLYDHASDAKLFGLDKIDAKTTASIKEQIYNEMYQLADVAAQHSYTTASTLRALANWKYHKKKIIGAGAAAGAAVAGAAAYKTGLLPSLESFKKDTSDRIEKPSIEKQLLAPDLKANLQEQARIARALEIQNAEFADLLSPKPTAPIIEPVIIPEVSPTPSAPTKQPSRWESYMDWVQARQKADEEKNASVSGTLGGAAGLGAAGASASKASSWWKDWWNSKTQNESTAQEAMRQADIDARAELYAKTHGYDSYTDYLTTMRKIADAADKRQAQEKAAQLDTLLENQEIARAQAAQFGEEYLKELQQLQADQNLTRSEAEQKMIQQAQKTFDAKKAAQEAAWAKFGGPESILKLEQSKPDGSAMNAEKDAAYQLADAYEQKKAAQLETLLENQEIAREQAAQFGKEYLEELQQLQADQNLTRSEAEQKMIQQAQEAANKDLQDYKNARRQMQLHSNVAQEFAQKQGNLPAELTAENIGLIRITPANIDQVMRLQKEAEFKIQSDQSKNYTAKRIGFIQDVAELGDKVAKMFQQQTSKIRTGQISLPR